MQRHTRTVLLLALLAPAQAVIAQAANKPTPPAESGSAPSAPPPAASAPGTGNAQPKLVHAANPQFTELARQRKVHGNCLVGLTVDTEGLPQDVRVLRSIADGLPEADRKAARSLDEKAIEAVRQYRFKPALRDGKPVATQLHIAVNFQIL